MKTQLQNKYNALLEENKKLKIESRQWLELLRTIIDTFPDVQLVFNTLNMKYKVEVEK